MADYTNCGCSVAELAANIKSLQKSVAIVLSTYADSRVEHREDMAEVKRELAYLQRKLNFVLRGA